jgi:hypothetical protein
MKTNRNIGWDAALGSADLKTVVAVLFAVGGLSWGAVSILSGRDKPGDDKPRVIASALDNEGNAVEPQYSKASSDRQIDRVQEELEAAVDLQAQAALRSIAVPKGLPTGVSDAVVNAFIPILSGNHDSFLDAIVAMGGEVPGELDGEHPMFKQLAKVFEGAKVDLSRISVSKYEAPAGRGMGMRRDVVTDDQDIEPGQDGMPAVQTSVMEMRPASLFPDAPSKNDPTALEVKVPVQPKGDDNESIFSLILTWNPDAKHWQPAAYRTIRNRLMEED